MKGFFKAFAATLVLATAATAGQPAGAQTYPDRVITMIVPFAAGGPTDATARLIAAGMSDKLGQNIIVENVSGGGSTIGTGRVARAAPDGYTLLLHNLAISANVSLYPKLNFHPEKDLTPIGFVNHNALVLVGRKSLPPNSMSELATWMKSNRGRFAHPGTGSTGHLASALFAQAVGAPIDYIPYRGGAPALQDVIGGHVDFFFGTTQAVLEPIKAGTVKAYGVTSKEPLPELPDVPSFAKQFGPKLDILFWHALFAPAGTPQPIVDKLNTALQDVLNDPKLVKAWTDTGIGIYPKEQRTAAAAKTMLHDEIERWGEVIRANNIEPPQQ